MHLRSYHGQTDNERMLALAREHPAGHVHVVDLPYRLCSWAFDNPGNVALWEGDHGRLLAWAVLQTPFWTLDYAIHPAAPPDAFSILLDWADGQAHSLLSTDFGRPVWFVALAEGQEKRRQQLAAAGYEAQDTGEDAWSQVTLVLAGGVDLPACPLKAGYRLRPLRGEAEAVAYVELHRAVFGTENMTVGWRQAVIRHPAYRPELDLVIENAAGEWVAFAVGWLAEQPSGIGQPPAIVGQIEPIGVNATSRRHGLAWSILAEVVRRLRSLGAGKILVQTDNYRDRAFAFYSAAGFGITEHVTIFRKEFVVGIQEV